MHTEIITTTTRNGYFGEKTVLAFVVSNSGREIIEDGARPADVDDAVLKFSAGTHRRAGSGCAREFDINFPKCISLLVLLVASDTLLPLAKRWSRLGMALLLRALRPDRENEHDHPAGSPRDDRIAQFGLRCIAAAFLEGVTRPIGRVCDPHLHAHIVMSTVVKNADDTYQPVDFERAKRLLPGIQREVVQMVAHDLRRCGVPIRWHKSQWIVEGLSAALIDKFCSRTRQILAAGLKHNRCSYGAAKAIDARLSVLQPQWRAALTADELRALDGIAARLHPPEPTQTNIDAVLRVAVEAALANELWVCTDDLVAAIAPEYCGQAAPFKLKKPLKRLIRRGDWRLADGEAVSARALAERVVLTSPRRLDECVQVYEAVRRSCGKFKNQLDANFPAGDLAHQLALNGDGILAVAPPGGKRYWAAVEATLSLIQRTKTVGFSTRMPRDVFRSAVRYIFAWHHTHATLADRLHHRDKDLPDVLWVHEPETIPARMLGNMIVDAAASGRRLVLGIGSGSRPFRSAGSFLLRLRLNAGLQVVGLDCSGARELCRIAVQLGLDSRVRMTCDQRSINVTQAAELVVEKLRAGRTAVLVCAERREVEQADLVIRQRISEAAGVRPTVKLQLLRERVLGVADRCLSSSYRKGDILIPQTNQFGFRAGEQLEVFGTSATAILVLSRKRRRPGLLQPGATPRFAVFETFETELAVGDQVRITRRSKSLEGHEMRPGDVLRIAGVDGNRNVRFEDGRCLARDFGHVAPFVACTPATLPRRVDCAFITSSALPVLAVRALSKLVRHDLVFTGSDEEALRKYLARSLPLRIRPTRWDPRPEPLVDAAPSAIAKSPSSVPAGAPLKTPTPPPKSFEVS